MSHFLFILVCCIWGTSFIFMKWGMASFGPVGVGAMRVVFGSIALALVWKTMRRKWPLVKRDTLPVIGLSLIGYCGPFCLQPIVVRGVEATAGHGGAFGGMMVSFVPLLTLIVSIPMLRVYPTARQLLGVLGGIACMWFLFADELNQGVPPIYLALGAITPLCYAIANTYLKRRFSHVSPMFMAMAAMAVTSVVLTPLAIGVEDVKVNEALPFSIASLFVLGVFCTGVATSLFYRLIQGHGPLYAGMVAYIIPCVAMGVGYLDGETITRTQLLAMGGVFVMVGLAQYKTPVAVQSSS